MIPKILAVAFVAMLPALSPAAACRARVVVQHQAVAAVAVQEVAVVQPVFVPVSLYSAGYYAPSQQMQAQSQQDQPVTLKDLKPLFDEVVRIGALVDNRKPGPILRENGPPPLPEKLPAPPQASDLQEKARALLSARCASCHEASVADKKGGDHKFVLLVGEKLVNLTDAQKRDVEHRIYTEDMPRGGKKFTDEEFSIVFLGLK